MNNRGSSSKYYISDQRNVTTAYNLTITNWRLLLKPTGDATYDPRWTVYKNREIL
jgi:hypothetical protein